MKCNYLDGENIKPRTAAEVKLLIGKRVQYLQESDIDKSGRGYFFPQTGTVTGSSGRDIIIDESTYINRSSLREMREIPA